MDTRAYYNEIDPFAAAWLRNLIKEGLIPDGEVDTRSIADVDARDLAGFTQCHFFAGIAGWAHALRLAGWSDDRPIWTGSCPCQPFSVAGKGKGTEDERHLWPVFFNLIRECRPPVVMGEQVSGKAGYGWLDGVRADLEEENYACRGVDIPACAVDAPHIRQRLYWVAVEHASSERRREGRAEHEVRSGRSTTPGASCGNMADADDERREGWPVHAKRPDERSAWSDGVEWRRGADGKARRVKSSVRLLVDGLPNRAGRLRGYGNAIVPPLAAEVIEAFMDA